MKTSLINLLQICFRFFGLEVIRKRPWMTLKGILNTYQINTIIDVGANEGQFALEALKTNSEFKVFSFEPISETFIKLKDNVKNYSNIFCYNIAFGDTKCEMEININKFNPSSSLLETSELLNRNYKHASTIEKREKIRVDTLDSFFVDNKINGRILLKIDVQGFEENVLNGGKVLLSEIDVVLIEATFQELYKGQILFGDLFNKLKSHDFVFVGMIDSSYDASTNELLFSNAIFKKK